MPIVEVVKYNGSPNVFVWKYPSEELGTWTQLIVNESQEAILYRGGQALDLFTAGRYTLETTNIPFLNKIVNLPFGGRSPFAAEVWYINKVQVLDIKWGTSTPIQLQDPKYKLFLPVRCFGQFGIKIDDSRKFITKIVGTAPIFDKDSLIKYFRGLYLMKIKDTISSYVIKKQISVLEINAYLDEISVFLKNKMVPILNDYGIDLVNFYVNDINVPEEDFAIKKLKEALAKKAEMDIVGYSYTQERSFDTLEGAAKNTGSGQSGLMGAGVGLGMGVGFGGVMGDAMRGIAGTIKCSNDTTEKSQYNDVSQTLPCSRCGHELYKTTKFCPECGKLYNPCLNCGTDMPQGAKICNKCGTATPKSCPKCGYIVLNSNTNFCPECGECLIRKCENCGVKVEGTPKFCPECGNKL